MNQSQAIEALAALAHETRIEAFRLLVRAAPQGLPTGEIAARLDVLQNTMSTHLAVLARAGLIDRQREGRTILCSASLDGMQSLLTYLLQDCCQGDETICAPLLEAANCAC